MNAKTVQYVAVGVLAVAALYYMRNRREAQQQADASGVTTTDKTGVTTTPIKTHAVAVIAEPFKALTGLARSVVSIPAAVIQGGAPDRLQPYGSPAAAAGAYNSPLRPDYVPTIRAADNVVYVK